MKTLIVALLCFTACGTDQTRSAGSAVLTASFDSPTFVTLNRSAAQTAASHRLSAEGISDLLRTEESRVLLSLLAGCALASDESITATVDGFELEFFGETGLAPRWLRRPLERAERRWVSSCIFARLNIHAEMIPISMRGARHQLAAAPDERGAFPLQEGAFWGDMFAEPQIEWFACRGSDLLTIPLPGGLVDRDCAKQDPAHPEITQCGMSFAGDCASVCDHDRRHCKHSGQVITTYVAP
jgi:hypothetical protein